MSSFYSSSQRRLQSNVCSYRYPSYLMKVSPPQVCSNFDSNNMLLLPKICNKYYVRKNRNSIMNNINYVDDLSVKSTVELDDTASMKLVNNDFKMTNNDDYTGFESCSNHSFGSFKQSNPHNFRYPSYLMKVSPPQECSNFNPNNMLLLPKICNKYCVRKNCNSVTNNIYCIDDLSSKSNVELNDAISMKPTCTKFKITNRATDNFTGFDSGSFGYLQQSASFNFSHSSYPMNISLPQVCTNLENMLMQDRGKINSVDVKSANLNNNQIKTTNTPKNINQENNNLTLTSTDLKIEDDDDVRVFIKCKQCNKSRSVDNFDWEKVSKTNKIKLLEKIKQNSKNQESYSI